MTAMFINSQNRGPSIDASYQVSVHLEAMMFLRGEDYNVKRLTDDGHQVMAKAHVAFGKAS